MESYEYNGEKYYFKKGKWLKSDYTVAPISVVNSLNKLLMENEDFETKTVDEIIKLLDGAKMSGNTGFALKLAEESLEKATLSEARALLPRITSLYRIKNRPERAVELGEHYIRVYESKISSPSLFTSLAAAYCDLNELEKARKYANRARAISGNNSSVELMSVYARLKKLEEDSPNIVQRDKEIEQLSYNTSDITSVPVSDTRTKGLLDTMNKVENFDYSKKEAEYIHVEINNNSTSDIEINNNIMAVEKKKRFGKRTYNDWVLEYPDRVIIRKEGFFYTVKDECAYIIATILKYNIGKFGPNETPITGSPSLEIMTNELKSHHISYIAIVGEEIIDEEAFKDNQFNEFISLEERQLSIKKIKERKTQGLKLRKDDAKELLGFIETLKQGVDPITGEIYDEDHFLYSAEMKEILDIAQKKIETKITAFDNKLSVNNLDYNDQDLYERLKECRMNMAKELGVPAYTICHNSTLANISQRRPGSKEEMLTVPGVGEKAFEKYGEAFLDIINDQF